MKISNEATTFADEFIKQLDTLIRKMETYGHKQKLSKVEINSVICTTCRILGKDSRKWVALMVEEQIKKVKQK